MIWVIILMIIWGVIAYFAIAWKIEELENRIEKLENKNKPLI